VSQVLTEGEFEQWYLASRDVLVGAAFLFPVPPDATLDLRCIEEAQTWRNHHETFTA